MKVTCLQENLNRGLSIVGRAVASRTTLPITNNILLATDQGRLKLAATNLEIAISHWIGATIEEEGAITVPARLITEFISALPNDKLSFTHPAQSRTPNTVQLQCARFEARISTMKAEDFPPIPKVGDGITTMVDPKALHSAITQVAFAAATDDARPTLTGVAVELSSEGFTLAAADGFRLAVHQAALSTTAKEKTSLIVPARAMAELNRLLADQEDPVELSINPNKSQVLFHLTDTDLVSQLIQGTFPNYAQLIPQSYACRAVVNVSEFLRATRTASIFARDASGIVRLQVTPGDKLSPGKMIVSARAEEVGDDVGEIDARVDGEAAKIAFNGRYLLDVLQVLDTQEVALETNSPSSPGVIRPVGSDSYVHVIMPMFVQW